MPGPRPEVALSSKKEEGRRKSGQRMRTRTRMRHRRRRRRLLLPLPLSLCRFVAPPRAGRSFRGLWRVSRESVKYWVTVGAAAKAVDGLLTMKTKKREKWRERITHGFDCPMSKKQRCLPCFGFLPLQLESNDNVASQHLHPTGEPHPRPARGENARAALVLRRPSSTTTTLLLPRPPLPLPPKNASPAPCPSASPLQAPTSAPRPPCGPSPSPPTSPFEKEPPRAPSRGRPT